MLLLTTQKLGRLMMAVPQKQKLWCKIPAHSYTRAGILAIKGVASPMLISSRFVEVQP